jgi:hypothetical protein
VIKSAIKHADEDPWNMGLWTSFFWCSLQANIPPGVNPNDPKSMDDNNLRKWYLWWHCSSRFFRWLQQQYFKDNVRVQMGCWALPKGSVCTLLRWWYVHFNEGKINCYKAFISIFNIVQINYSIAVSEIQRRTENGNGFAPLFEGAA